MKVRFLYFFLFLAFISCTNEVKFNSPALEGLKDNSIWRASNTRARLANSVLTVEGFTGNEKLTLKIPVPSTMIKITEKTSHITHLLGTTSVSAMAMYSNLIIPTNATLFETSATKGPVNKVSIDNAGLDYEVTIAGTTGGSGTGLKVRTTITDTGAISAVTVATAGIGYLSGDVVTISGGNGKATLTVQNVATSNGEIIITGYNGVGSILSGTFRFKAIKVSNDASSSSNVIFQYGNFYVPVD